MIFRNLDQNGDWTFGHGKSNYATGNLAVGLNLKTRLLSWVGDCFFDMKAGIDWTNRLGSKNQQTLLAADIQRITQQSFGITSITSFNARLAARAFTAQEAVNTYLSQSYLQSVAQGTKPNV